MMTRARISVAGRVAAILSSLLPAMAMAAGSIGQGPPVAEPVADTAQQKLAEARALAGSGNLEGAMAALREGLIAAPENPALHNALGAFLNMSGRYPEALVHAERAAQGNPAEPRYRYNRGIVLAEHGRFAEALADFDFAIRATPDQAPMYLERGAALLSLGRDGDAREDWKTARRLDPALVWVDWYEGLHDLIDGRTGPAVAAFERVAAAQPDFAAAQLWLTAAHRLAGSSFQPAAVNDPWVARLLDLHAGRIGIEPLLEAARADSASGDSRRKGEAWLHHGIHLRRSGRPDEADAAVRQSIAVAAPRHAWKLLAERLVATDAATATLR